MEALTLFIQQNARLLRRAITPPRGKQPVRVTGRYPDGSWRVCSATPDQPDHRLTVTEYATDCDCTAATVSHKRCTHAAILTAFLAWQRAQEVAG